MTNEQKKILVVDIPASASAEEAERLLTEPLEQGYYLKNVFPWPGLGARAVYPLLAKRETTDKPVDGHEEDALQIIRNNPTLSIRALVLKLRIAGIERSKTWVGDKRFELAAVKLSK
jgi:hypothetical protein